MAEGTEQNEEAVKVEREEIFSNAVRAGKRTYFFDVKTTRRNDYYLTLTESKKRFNRDGRFYFEKHKIFLYKEDFEKFMEGLTEAIEYIRANAPEILDEPLDSRDEDVSGKIMTQKDLSEERHAETEISFNEVNESDQENLEDINSEVGKTITENFTDIEFEDLGEPKKLD